MSLDIRYGFCLRDTPLHMGKKNVYEQCVGYTTLSKAYQEACERFQKVSLTRYLYLIEHDGPIPHFATLEEIADAYKVRLCKCDVLLEDIPF